MESNTTLTNTNKEICDDYVCGLCPNDLFLNTSASLGKCSKLHSEEAREMINETISNTPEYSVLPKHLKNLEDILHERDRKVSRAKCWKNSTYTTSEKVDNLMNEIEQLNQKILEKQTGFDDLHEDDIKDLNQLLLEQDLKYDKLNEILISNIDEVKLNVCNICSQYLPIDKSESTFNLHNNNSVHKAYLEIQKKVTSLHAQRTKNLQKHKQSAELKQ